jgi:hypothetical protein
MNMEFNGKDRRVNPVDEDFSEMPIREELSLHEAKGKK